MQTPNRTERIAWLTKMPCSVSPKALLVLNVIGVFVYLFAASRGGWAIPEERVAGIYTTTGEPFIWFSNILPVVVTFMVINVAWGVAILICRNWRGGIFWLIAAVIWLGGVVVDFAHH